MLFHWEIQTEKTLVLKEVCNEPINVDKNTYELYINKVALSHLLQRIGQTMMILNVIE